MLQGQPVLYCRSGDKTKELAEKLAEQGMPVAFLEGGMLAWEADGLPIERALKGPSRSRRWQSRGIGLALRWRHGGEHASGR